MLCTNKDFVLRRIYGKNILVPIKDNQTSLDPILLNDVASSIWEEADKCSDRGDIVGKIANAYGLMPESPEIEAVNNFVIQLINMGLIREEV